MKKIATLLLGLSMAACVLAATPASYPGGAAAMQKFITDNMVYPAPALNNGIEGVVTVSFSVAADGSIGTIKIVRMVDPDLEQEAIRLVKKMPAWKPATDDAGNAVVSTVTADIPFNLPSE